MNTIHQQPSSEWRQLNYLFYRRYWGKPERRTGRKFYFYIGESYMTHAFLPVNCFTSGMTSHPGNRPRKPQAAAASPKVLALSPMLCFTSAIFCFILCCAACARLLRVTRVSDTGCGMCSKGVVVTAAGPPKHLTCQTHKHQRCIENFDAQHFCM